MQVALSEKREQLGRLKEKVEEGQRVSASAAEEKRAAPRERLTVVCPLPLAR